MDPTYDFLTLAVAGLALFLSPWVGGFNGETAGATAWVAGALATAIGVAGYLRGENLNVATTARDDAGAPYGGRVARTA
ncbi:MAG TPA: SPW repeat protein [Mycobacterium sp.]|nr:SPW repeat protein [Mycobacterium sp.]